MNVYNSFKCRHLPDRMNAPGIKTQDTLSLPCDELDSVEGIANGSSHLLKLINNS